MKLWTAMQRIETYRYHAERMNAQARNGSPEERELFSTIERQWLDLAAHTQTLFESRQRPQARSLHYEAAPEHRATSEDLLAALHRLEERAHRALLATDPTQALVEARVRKAQEAAGWPEAVPHTSCDERAEERIRRAEGSAVCSDGDLTSTSMSAL